MDADLERAAAVLGDLRRLTGYRLDAQHFAERTLALVLDNWCAVEALASALIVTSASRANMVERSSIARHKHSKVPARRKQ